jgi:transposase
MYDIYIAMYIEKVPNRNSRPAILLREGWREGGKVKKRTIANLTDWPQHVVEALRLSLKGKELVSVDDAFETVSSKAHGHVKAVLTAMEKLGIKKLIASRPSRERDIIYAVIAWRVIKPASKLAMQREWRDSTLPEMVGLDDSVTEDDIYEAMDWLLASQNRIEKKLAKRHLTDGGLMLYDLTSSYFEGTTCPLAALGYNRDKKRGKLQVNYGLMASGNGCPVGVSVFPGNVGDPKTLIPAAEKARSDFSVSDIVLVGDRGMMSQKQIDKLKEIGGIEWITALKTGAIRSLVKDGSVQLGLFDERNLFSFEHADYPGEQLVACRNPELAKLRAHKRQSLIEATMKELEKVRGMAGTGKLKGADAIGVRTGKVVNKYKVAKHFELNIEDDRFDYSVNEKSVAEEAALDGIYVVRTSLPKERISPEDAVRNYKSLSNVERAFRSMKTVDLLVRPIHHRTEDRVRAHIFLCMLSYYVQWHMVQAWRPLTFADEDQDAKATRDPVAPAKRSDGALAKAELKTTEDDDPVHSFRSLLEHLGSIVRNHCTRDSKLDMPPIVIDSTPTEYQQKALDLLKEITL